MSESVYFLTIGLPLAAVLLIFAMKYFSAVQQAKARLANDEGYRQIAAKVAAGQAETAVALASIDGTLADIKSRLAAVEKMLKEVD